MECRFFKFPATHAIVLVIIYQFHHKNILTFYLGCQNTCECEQTDSSNCSFYSVTIKKAMAVHCNNKGIISIPTLPAETVFLDLSHNKIQNISDFIWTELYATEVIDLSFNQISVVKSDFLLQKKCLRELILTNNRISIFPFTIITVLPNIQVVDVSFNQITYIDLNISEIMEIQKENVIEHYDSHTTITEKSKLRNLSLSHNPLLDIQNVSILFHSLIHLNLSNTRITNFKYIISMHLQSLRNLDLSNNNINHLGPESFKSMKYLKYLSLYGNPFICDCHLIELRKWITENKELIRPSNKTVTCQRNYDSDYLNLQLVPLNDFVCVFTPARVHSTLLRPITYAPYKSALGPIPYDPMLGWYTAAFLFGMLLLLVLCILLEKLKGKYVQWKRSRKNCRKKYSTLSANPMFEKISNEQDKHCTITSSLTLPILEEKIYELCDKENNHISFNEMCLPDIQPNEINKIDMHTISPIDEERNFIDSKNNNNYKSDCYSLKSSDCNSLKSSEIIITVTDCGK